jgi:DNA-binding MarR family transcriptional regulator
VGKDLYDRLKEELEAREKSHGLTTADILKLPEPLRPLCSWMSRAQQVALSDVATFLGQDESQASRTLADLVNRGFVRQVTLREGTHFRVRLVPRRGREVLLNLWQALEDKTSE